MSLESSNIVGKAPEKFDAPIDKSGGEKNIDINESTIGKITKERIEKLRTNDDKNKDTNERTKDLNNNDKSFLKEYDSIEGLVANYENPTIMSVEKLVIKDKLPKQSYSVANGSIVENINNSTNEIGKDFYVGDL